MRRSLSVAVALAVALHVGVSAQSPHGGTQRLQPGPNTNAAGGVVNPSDPAALVKADILLQRQNETVVGASSRNSDHILAAANDYRFVDFPDDPGFGGGQNFITRLIAKFLGRPLGKPLPIRATGGPVGAWTGVYRSCDRGRTWIGSALPGGPLDNSPASVGSATVQRSPLKDLSDEAIGQGGHAETTDPFLMAGPGGRMHMVVLGFVRFPNGGVGTSRMYYASYTDRNDREGGGCFNYDFTRLVDNAANYVGPGAPNPFIDKPSMAVDKDGSIYISYTVFTDSVKSKIVIARSNDGGATWKKTIPLLNLGFLRNHGTSTTVDANGIVYVAWRLFYQNWPLMVVSRSFDGGKTFLPATPISHWWPAKSLDAIVQQLKAARLQPFDQFGDTGIANPLTATARSLAFPSIAAGVVNGQSRLFAVWQERADVDPASPTFGQPLAGGSPRVMFTMSTDGGWSWTPRKAIDAGPRPDLATGGNPAPPSGPQLQPIVSISGVTNPQLVVLFYEARDELAGGPPYDDEFISGIGRQMDVRAVRINPVSGALVAPSVQVSQYAIQANTEPAVLTETAPGFPQVHRENLTMYGGGLKAFFGDYPHLTASTVFERGSPWKWANEPSSMLAMWTDNRDAQFPLTSGQPNILGDWTAYTPLKPNGLPGSCAYVATRNANPYFAEIAGVVAGSPQTFKRLNIQRAFVTYVENRTPQDRFFRFTLVPQAGIVPSFLQLTSDLSIDVQIFGNSSRTQTVWVAPNPQNPTGFVRMVVEELENGAIKAGGYRTSLVLNADPNNAALTTVPSAATVPPGTNKSIDASELHNPQVSAPQVSAFTVRTPQVSAPQVSAPQVSAPQVSALGMPQVSAPQVSAPQVSAPQVSAPQVSATAPGEPPNGTDTTFNVNNAGNTETVYDAFLNVPNVEQLLNSGNYQFQVLITRTSLAPGFTQTAAGCIPAAQTKVQVIANLQVPQVSAPQISAINNPQVSAPQVSAIATFSVAPEGGASPIPVPDNQSTVLPDQVQITLRAIRLTPFSAGGPTFNPNTVQVEIKSESANVINGAVQANPPTASTPTPAAPTFLVSNTNDSGAGSLRQAILNANANPDINTIFFNVAAPRTITPLSALPTITSPVVIDGASQPGFQGVPLIELNGTSAGSANGLHLTTANSVINGLVINRFTGEGIRIDGPTSTGNVISGNYIGANAAGTAALGNTNSGIFIRRAGGNFVLGNVVSGNNGFAGIAICGAADFCGGGADTGNPIDASGNVIRGNFIGVAADGSTPLGNIGYGVSLDGAPNTLVGGTAGGAGNVIAFNGTLQGLRPGVAVFNTGATGNQIVANSIHSNTGLGIDLADEVTSPVLTSALANTVEGSLNGTPETAYVIDFYSSPVCDPSGFGEGQTPVGSITVTSPGAFTASLLANVPDGMQITALATSTGGGTSEFSNCQLAGPPPPPPTGGTITSVSPSTGAPGEGMLVVRGSGFPDPASGIAIVSNGTTTMNGFVFASPSTLSAYWVRLPGNFPTGPANIQIYNPSTAAVSNAFPITVAATPGTPIITKVLNSDFIATTIVFPGQTIYVQADGIDTLGAIVRFEQAAGITDVTPVQAVSSATIGLAVQITVPSGLTSGPVSVSIRQGTSAFSAPVTLTVPPQ